MMSQAGNRILRTLQQRGFHTTRVRFIDPSTVEEVRIPVPWGHIAGKQWGGKDPSIIALHGHLDNASSFDKLMPLLSTSSVLCLDLPGHGLSSHLPQGLCLEYPQYIVLLRYLFKHCLRLSKVSFIGHSFGSSLCFAYAGLYPDDVQSMVNIDCSRLASGAIEEMTVGDLRASIDLAVSSDVEKVSGGYSWEDSVKYTYNARKKGYMPLSLEGCEIISRRGMKNVGDGIFRFSTDSRLKVFGPDRLSAAFNEALAKRINCKVLNIKPNNGFHSLSILKFINKEFNRQIEEMKKLSKNILDVNVDGGHHVHLEQPENVSSIINEFMNCR